jgi:hypothetical protein
MAGFVGIRKPNPAGPNASLACTNSIENAMSVEM